MSNQQRSFVRGRARFFDGITSAIHDEIEREKQIKRRNQDIRRKHLENILRGRKENLSSAVELERNVNQLLVEEIVPKLGEEPPPMPPSTTKEVLYGERESIDLFDDLEQYAINMESEDIGYPALMKELFIWKLTDLEKVRILFHWISSQDLNAITFPDDLAEDSPLGQLKAIKENRLGYHVMFQRLCNAAGIHCKLIEGFVKGVDCFPDHSFTSNPNQFRSKWTAVLIDNEWRFIETDWGARAVNLTTRETVYRFDEHYFLTDPDQFVTSHFPDEMQWQLLHQPITLDQFQNSVRKWPTFYKFKLHLDSHQNGWIETDENGYVEVSLRFDADTGSDLKFTSTLQGKNEKKLGDKLLQPITQDKTNEKVIFRVRVPKIGQYILSLFGGVAADVSSNLLCRYQINASKCSTQAIPLIASR